MSKLIDKIKNSITAEMLFFTAFISRLVIATWDTTMFPQVGIIRKIALVLVLVCATAKIVFYNTHTLSEIIVIGFCGFCAVMNLIKSGSNVFLILFLLVVAAQGIEFRKILQIYLAVVGSIVGFAFLCSSWGIIENLKYWQAGEHLFRNSFGITYCTDFAAHVLFLILAYYYLRGSKLKWFEYLITVGIVVFVYETTRAKLDSICVILVILFFGIGNLITNRNGLNKVLKHRWESFWKMMAPASLLICPAVMFGLTFMYDEDVSWMAKLNKTLSLRLSYGNSTFKEKGFGLFGQKVTLYGYGGTTISPGYSYNFTDCSYLYILILSGLVILIATILVYMYISFRNSEDLYLLYAITIIGINCMIAHHMQDISYIPFIIAAMASVVPKAKEKEEYVSSKIQCFINF